MEAKQLQMKQSSDFESMTGDLRHLVTVSDIHLKFLQEIAQKLIGYQPEKKPRYEFDEFYPDYYNTNKTNLKVLKNIQTDIGSLLELLNKKI